MELRAVSAGDGPALDALMRRHPGWHGAAYHDQRFSGASSPSLRLVATEAGAVVGYAETLALPMLRGRRAPALVFVDPAHRGRGIGGRLWREVTGLLRDAGVPGTLLVADRDDATTLAVAEAHGLVDVGEHLESTLDLASLDLASLGLVPPATRLAPLDEPAGRDLVHALVLELGEDTPDVGPGNGMPREVFDRLLREPWQGLLTLDGDQVSGLIAGFARDEPGEANIALMGVRAPWRGRGLAAPLMAAWALVLRERGFTTLVTQNLTSNVPALRANDRLGFVVRGGYRDLAYDS